MPKKKKSKHRIYLAATLSFVGAILIVSCLALVAPKVGRWAVIKDTDKILNLVKAGISKEELSLRDKAKEVAMSGVLDGCFDKEVAAQVAGMVEKEKNQLGLSALVIVCPNGLTLIRQTTEPSSGDYAFLTTDYGRATGEGKAVAGIGQPTTFPIAVVGTYPLIEGGVFKGAVFAGKRFDDQFARYFKNKYLPKNVEVGFYSLTQGLTGESLESAAEDIVHAYFSAGSDWATGERNNELATIKLENKKAYYYLKNLPLSGVNQENIGGVVVFVGYNFYLIALLVALLIALIKFAASMLGYRKFRMDWPLVHLVTALLVLVYSLLIFEYGVQHSSTVLQKPNQVIYNSVLNISPESGVIDLSHSQKINITASSGGEAVNTALVEIDFDPKAVSVEDILSENSICDQELIFERQIDNQDGKVLFGCLMPNPGFSGENGVIFSLVIRPLRTGNAVLSFGSDTRVLANDGLGTDVLRSSIGASYKVLDYRAINNDGNLNLLLLFSPSHPNSERWYNRSVLFMYWPQIRGAKYYYTIDKNEENEFTPDKLLPLNYLTAQLTGDGEYFVHAQARLADGTVTPVSTYPIKLDFTPPESPTIKANKTILKTGEVLRISVESSDETSGLQEVYYYKVDDSILLPTGKTTNIYLVDPGVHTITVRVFDNAGNFSESAIKVKVNKK